MLLETPGGIKMWLSRPGKKVRYNEIVDMGINFFERFFQAASFIREIAFLVEQRGQKGTHLAVMFNDQDTLT